MIALSTEKRMLQAAVALACVVPLAAGLGGAVKGPAMLGVDGAAIDLDSHFRYLSGLLLAIGLGFLTCLPRIEDKQGRFLLLGAVVIVGGLARLWGFAAVGVPTTDHRFGLAMELLVVPCLMAWQAGFARRWARAGGLRRPAT